jgi:hypothetical protein
MTEDASEAGIYGGTPEDYAAALKNARRRAGRTPPEMPRYTAVLDACVLVPIALADTLLRVAERGLYRSLWTDPILSEAQAALEEIHPSIDVSKRFASMREAFDRSLITGWEDLEGGLSLPDEDDRHVVAAAIKGGAQAIITANLADFPIAALGSLGWRQSTPTTSCSTNST